MQVRGNGGEGSVVEMANSAERRALLGVLDDWLIRFADSATSGGIDPAGYALIAEVHDQLKREHYEAATTKLRRDLIDTVSQMKPAHLHELHSCLVDHVGIVLMDSDELPF